MLTEQQTQRLLDQAVRNGMGPGEDVAKEAMKRVLEKHNGTSGTAAEANQKLLKAFDEKMVQERASYGDRPQKNFATDRDPQEIESKVGFLVRGHETSLSPPAAKADAAAPTTGLEGVKPHRPNHRAIGSAPVSVDPSSPLQNAGIMHQAVQDRSGFDAARRMVQQATSP